MANKERANPSSGELKEEELRAVAGGSGDGELIRSLPRNNSDMAICTKCGQLKRIEYFYHKKRICGACLKNAN